jgi:hypothetical protein
MACLENKLGDKSNASLLHITTHHRWCPHMPLLVTSLLVYILLAGCQVRTGRLMRVQV